MSETPLIYQFAAINKREEEVKANRWKAIQDAKLPEQVGEVATGWPYTASTDQDFIC